MLAAEAKSLRVVEGADGEDGAHEKGGEAVARDHRSAILSECTGNFKVVEKHGGIVIREWKGGSPYFFGQGTLLAQSKKVNKKSQKI